MTLGQQVGMNCFCTQVGENLSDHYRIFDTGNDSDITPTFAAGFNELAAQRMGPTGPLPE